MKKAIGSKVVTLFGRIRIRRLAGVGSVSLPVGLVTFRCQSQAQRPLFLPPSDPDVELSDTSLSYVYLCAAMVPSMLIMS